MKIILFILSLTIFFATTGAAQNNRAVQKAKKPNIIFILTDDLGYGDVGIFFQNERKKTNDRSEPWMATPQLDQLARQGARLTQHYCGAPVCAPARSSLLSGKSQGHANVRDNQFDKALEDNHTMASTL
ncbi:MAG: sulfatase-like hydrolase/transferase, partial [Chitinophagaceae bacterium]